MKKILLITGWLGYIWSHAVIEFETSGYTTIIIDSLIHSSRDALVGMKKILGYTPVFLEGSIGDSMFLEEVFSKYSFDGVIHFAGLKAVGESTQKISLYHHNNISGSIVLFEVMERYKVKNIVFSSSATVYDAQFAPEYREDTPLKTSNPYGTTKFVIEQLLQDYTRHANWSVMSLRYFNPIWAHPSGYIGEQQTGVPTNLLPYVLDVAAGKHDAVQVFGNDYDTPDGTGIRDYVDVGDVVWAHKKAYERLLPWYQAINVGTGRGWSVYDIIRYAEKITGKAIPSKVEHRRRWDAACYIANTQYAQKVLWWEAKTDLETSIKDAWNFIQTQQ